MKTFIRLLALLAAIACAGAPARALDEKELEAELEADPVVQSYWSCLSGQVDRFTPLLGAAPPVIVKAARGVCKPERDAAAEELPRLFGSGAAAAYKILDAIDLNFEEEATAAILQRRAGDKPRPVAPEDDLYNEWRAPADNRYHERPATPEERASLPRPPAGCLWLKGDHGSVLDCTR